MPVNLMRTTPIPAERPSNARNASVVVVALTAALVVLQFAGLVMVERSHAGSSADLLMQSGAPAQCAKPASVPAGPAFYD